MSGKRSPERDERVKLPLDPETALRALLKVKPGDEPDGDEPDESEHDHGSEKRSQS
jgi:hypothetical protein